MVSTDPPDHPIAPDDGPIGEETGSEHPEDSSTQPVDGPSDPYDEAIESLPDDYRELIQLRHFAELSYEEIATMKKMPLGTVKNKLFRGRQMLKQSLADYLAD